MARGFVSLICIGSGAIPRPFARVPAFWLGLALALTGVCGSASAATVNIYGNTATVTIPVSGSTSPYPSTIAVSGITANVITKVAVKLNGLTHTWPADLDVLLVGPGGERVMLMSDAGGGNPVSGIDLTFSPTATAAVPQVTALSTATVLPANYPDADSNDFSDAFPGPAPTVLDREPSDLTVFNGTNPNGTWSLYVTDDFQGADGGSIATGWFLFLTVPSVFTVTKTADTNDGVCDSDCSLREAIAAATAATGSDDLIRFSSLFDTPQTITLGGSALSIGESMTIQGPGADLLTVSGNGVSQVFTTGSGLITLSGLTVRDGYYPSDGGGIYANGTQLVLRNIAVAGNRSGGYAAGALLLNARSQFTGCTFSDNESDRGSAILLYSDLSAALKLINTTVSGNRSNARAAVWAFSVGVAQADLEIINSTVANNSGDGGGGILATTQGGIDAIVNVSLRNTILANNSAPNIATENFGGGLMTITSLGFNLADEDADGYFSQASDKVGVDPRLGPLTNNGGQTESHALMGGSPALDAGERSGYQKDQRNLPRAFDAPGVATAAGGDGSDIGALEMQVLMVTTHGDPGPGSLHQALLDANANGPGQDDILFDTDFFSVLRVMNLSEALPAIATSLSIVGPGSKLADVHRQAGGDYRIFEVSNAAGREVAISGLTISNGKFNGSGGGIFSAARISLTEVAVFANSSALAYGGGADLGRGTIKNSTFSLNSGTTMAGGLYARGSLRVINSTFSGNVAGAGGGGGIALVSAFGLTHTLELINSTIANNSAANGGGLKVHTEGGGASTATVLVRNSIIANNQGPNLMADSTGGGPAVIGSRGYNLTDDASATYFDQASDKINTNPLLGVLQDNGGPTSTHALLPGSPAIDAGGRAGYLSDQRRLRRPYDQALVGNAAGGDGSDIGTVEMVPEILFRDGFE